MCRLLTVGFICEQGVGPDTEFDGHIAARVPGRALRPLCSFAILIYRNGGGPQVGPKTELDGHIAIRVPGCALRYTTAS